MANTVSVWLILGSLADKEVSRTAYALTSDSATAIQATFQIDNPAMDVTIIALSGDKHSGRI